LIEPPRDKINFAAGQLVKEGDLLFEFASKSNELSLALAQATLKQAEAQLRLAEVNLKNKQTLRARNVGSEMELLETQAQRDIAAAKVEEARANAAIAEIALQQMKLSAPISGIISRSLIKEGAYITKEARDQSRLATIVQLDPINVIGQAPAGGRAWRAGVKSFSHSCITMPSDRAPISRSRARRSWRSASNSKSDPTLATAYRILLSAQSGHVAAIDQRLLSG
jgi:multidrug efflux pump subunit AcrA (membrane-fusion protein)